MITYLPKGVKLFASTGLDVSKPLKELIRCAIRKMYVSQYVIEEYPNYYTAHRLYVTFPSFKVSTSENHMFFNVWTSPNGLLANKNPYPYTILDGYSYFQIPIKVDWEILTLEEPDKVHSSRGCWNLVPIIGGENYKNKKKHKVLLPSAMLFASKLNWVLEEGEYRSYEGHIDLNTLSYRAWDGGDGVRYF
jgi:hypothetical protein